MTQGAAEPLSARPAEANAPRWDAFDPDAYVSRNYMNLHADDASIMRACSDYLRRHFRRHGPPPSSLAGIDVGTGANLYPAMILLPWCREITLLDFAPANVKWLEESTPHYGENWDAFWDVLRRGTPYAEITRPRERLRVGVRIERKSVFLLSERCWDIGTMFFTAESITASRAVFREAVRCFVRCLVPGAPFAAAFMAESRGYRVGHHSYPSCNVDEHTVAEGLAPYAEDLEIRRFREGPALRDGYMGMILACGRRRSTR
ncbi:hypothetical protein SUDANB176_04333 [Streptomyces sp. enrichment culture]|uniref:SCO2525 family SAM-dependent methyltransferase n=1 Tax=Streptomyces sp. enrichment culture TaxID=1795815 RepID=UPI003F5779F5